ncbi:ESPR-type extended signal peptide-containing protein [Stenotrophomonas sp.]|uniref:ESPR-type extended signal peptide-containing protein n=1 Tax=Stenotrophomonas sp. TaxID=69392 RepID=UPI00289D2F09|nr:ESPR-type extended signal peptide-containing protein [Stenotrophomonas sp.]
MNRIYRLIWNTTLRCWAVASEHTRSRGKPASATRVLGAALCVALAGPSLAADAVPDPDTPPAAVEEEAQPPSPTGAGAQLPMARGATDTGPAMARGAGATSYQNVLIGGGTTTNSTKGVAIGVGSATNFDGVGIGLNARGNAGGVAIGIDAATSSGSGGTAIGRNARSAAGGGTGAVAIGMNSYVDVYGNSAIAIGNSARAEGNNATALGNGAQASGGTSIAVGNNAKAPANGAIVIGDGGNLANANAHHAIVIGTGARSGGYDAGIAIGQNAVTDGRGKAVALGANANASHSNSVALGAGSVTTANHQISVGDATTQRKIVNVADATLGTTSTDAVTGKQLHATNQNVTTATNTANSARTTANDALAKANAASGLISQTAANGNLRLGGSNTGTALDVRNQSNANRRITGVADGALSTGSTEAVTGRQLHATNQNVTTATNTANSARTTANDALAKANAASGLISQTAANGNVRLGGNNTGSALDVRNQSNANRRITGVADGALSTSSTEAVTGRQLHATNQSVAGVATTANAAKTQADALAVSLAAATLKLGIDAAASGDGAVALGRQARSEGGVGNLAVGNGAQSFNTGSVALGDDARAGVDANGARVSTFNGGVAIGSKARSGNGAVASGLRAAAVGDRAIAIGNDAVADSTHASALGFGAQATAAQSTALGRGSVASAQLTTAVGNLSTASARSATAIGDRAAANHEGSVALGNGSTTQDANQVSVGNASLQRRIVNVGDGTLSTTSSEAVTGRQLHATNQSVSAVTTLANTAHSIANDAQTKANALGGLLSQSAGNGDVRVGASNTGGAVDMRNQSNASRRVTGVADAALGTGSTDAVSGRQLHATNQNVATVTATAATLGGLVGQAAANGNVRLGAQNTGTTLDVRNQANANRRISGVADGVVSASSADAVSGRQLNTTNQNVTAATTLANTAHTVANSAQTTANEAQTKATVLGGLLSQAAADGDMRLGAANSGGVLDVRNQGNQARRVQGVAAGQLSATSDDAVSGRQLFDSNTQIARNRTDIDRLREDFQDFDPDLSDVVRFDADGNVDLEGGRLLAVGEGQLSADSREAVNGAQLFATNTKVAEQGAQIASAREDLDALRVDFDNYAPDLGSVVQFGEDGTVDLKAARLVALADGEIAAGSREAVTGGQLFVTNERVSVLEDAQKYAVVGADGESLAARAGHLATSMGSDTKALGSGSTAIGSFADAQATNSVALGRAAQVLAGADDGFALGARSRVSAENGLAIGGSTQVWEGATTSVALGYGSVATEAGEVSLGGQGLRRRVTNAMNGIHAYDLTTVDQLSGVVNALGGGAGFATDGSVIAPSYGVQGAVHRTVADALAALDAGVDSNRGGLDAMDARLDTLDQARAMADASAVRFGADRSAVDFGGARLINVGEGDISHAGSREVVTGGQLHASNQRIAGLEEKHLYAVVGYDELSKPAEAALLGTALGSDTKALAEGATAIGSYAQARGKNSVSLGRAALVHVGAEDGFALGARSQVHVRNGVALGGASQVLPDAENSVALGHGSLASGAYEVSLGHVNLKRRVTNAANGRDASDLTTVSQLRSAFAALGGNMAMDANGNIIAPEFHVQGQRLATVGDALKSLDGAVIDNRRDLASIDARFNRLFDDTGMRDDGAGQLRLGGEYGMVLGNVANGMIAPGSRDAVNGGQLHAVQEQINGRIDGLQSQIDGPTAADNRQASVDDTATGEAPADPQVPQTPAKDAPAVASADVPKPGPKADDPLPAVDSRAVDEAVNQANAYTDQAMASVDRRLDRMDKRLNRMAAMGSAQAAMAMNTAGLQTYNRLGAGVGHAEGESALAVGYQRVLNERGSATFSLNGAFTNSGERTLGVGFGVGW